MSPPPICFTIGPQVLPSSSSTTLLFLPVLLLGGFWIFSSETFLCNKADCLNLGSSRAFDKLNVHIDDKIMTIQAFTGWWDVMRCANSTFAFKLPASAPSILTLIVESVLDSYLHLKAYIFINWLVGLAGLHNIWWEEDGTGKKENPLKFGEEGKELLRPIYVGSWIIH